MLQNVPEIEAEHHKTTQFLCFGRWSIKQLITNLQACSIKRNIGFEKCNTCVERTEVEMVVLIALVVYLLDVDIHESAMEAFLALNRYNQLNIKR